MKPIRQLFQKYAQSKTTPSETALVDTYFRKLQENGIDNSTIQSDETLGMQLYLKITAEIKESWYHRFQPFFPIAASILLLWSISGIHHFYFSKPVEKWMSLRANKGEQLDFYLSDSTQVYLSAGSELKYLSSFGEQDRKVYLTGEAFFKVKKKRDHQLFIVESTHLSVKVLGTQFNVQDVEGETTAVYVHSGKVEVKDRVHSRKQLVTANEQVIYSLSSGELTKYELDEKEINSWFIGQLKFRSASLTEVVNTLERRFDVVIDLKTSVLPAYHISGDFTNDSIEEVLKSLSFLYGISYVKNSEKHIEISFK